MNSTFFSEDFEFPYLFFCLEWLEFARFLSCNLEVIGHLKYRRQSTKIAIT